MNTAAYYADKIKALQSPRVLARELTRTSMMFSLRPTVTATLVADEEAGREQAILTLKVRNRLVTTFYLHRMDEKAFAIVSAYLSEIKAYVR